MFLIESYTNSWCFIEAVLKFVNITQISNAFTCETEDIHQNTCSMLLKTVDLYCNVKAFLLLWFHTNIWWLGGMPGNIPNTHGRFGNVPNQVGKQKMRKYPTRFGIFPTGPCTLGIFPDIHPNRRLWVWNHDKKNPDCVREINACFSHEFKHTVY